MISNAIAGAPHGRDRVTLGAQILKIALGFDQLLAHGASPRAALAEIRKRSGECDSDIVAALEKLELGPAGTETRCVRLSELISGMVLNQDVRAGTDSC